MIKKKDVIQMLVPFPNIESPLAKIPHMYICLESKQPKKFLKCQSFKTHFRNPSRPPYQFVEVLPDIKHNPFDRLTLVDCDKSFTTDHGVSISEKQLTTRRRNVSEELLCKLEEKIKHSDFKEIVLDAKTVAQLNDEIKLIEKG